MFSFFSFFERQKGAILEFFYAKRGGCNTWNQNAVLVILGREQGRWVWSSHFVDY